MKLRDFIRTTALVALVACTFTACEDDHNEMPSVPKNTGNSSGTTVNDAEVLGRLEFPKVKDDTDNMVVVHSVKGWGITYALEWDCKKKAQRWTCFQMHDGHPDKHIGRTVDTQANGYLQDPDIPADKRFITDPYWGTGYDHGHICASEDRQYDKLANTQTFYLSNMQPQHNKFNAGVWLNMEQQLQQKWNANDFRDVLYVVKGGTIDKDSQVRGYTKTGLLIPKYFFMAILCQKNGSYKALAFWVEHKDTDVSRDLTNYTYSIDYLEQQTGIDFFHNLPDDIENRIESATRQQIISDWKLN